VSDARLDGFGEKQRPWQGKLPGLQESDQSKESDGGYPDRLLEKERFQNQGSSSA
jgi:hypothetical protein